MSLNNFDIPTVMGLPDNNDGIINFVRDQIYSSEGTPDVIILDLRQRSAVIHRGELEDPELSAKSLPFLLSTHTVYMAGISPSISECIDTILSSKDIKPICIFLNPANKDKSKVGMDIFYSTIVNEDSVLSYYEDAEGKNQLSIINIGDSNER